MMNERYDDDGFEAESFSIIEVLSIFFIEMISEENGVS